MYVCMCMYVCVCMYVCTSVYVRVPYTNPPTRCSCGLSQNQPFCDGSHRSIEGNEDGSLIQPTRFTAEESKDMWFCMCKATGNADTDGTCDGAHHQEPVILKYNRQLLAANSELKAKAASLKTVSIAASVAAVVAAGAAAFLFFKKNK